MKRQDRGRGTRRRSRSRDYRRRWSDERRRKRQKRKRSPSSSTESSSQSRSGSGSDREGRISIRPGDYIGNRDRCKAATPHMKPHTSRGGLYTSAHKVTGVAGQGTFGTVLNVVDRKYNDELAVKVVRSVKRYLEAALVEEQILRKIKEKDPKKESCDIFGRLGGNYSTLSNVSMNILNTNNPMDAEGVCHGMKLVHTDLKPENILLEVSDYTLEKWGSRKDYRVPVYDGIRLIDFGGATFEDDHHSRIINTRQYRSPEVILGLGWSYASDIWSIGCILAEFYTGDLLFKTHENMEHLALMEKIIGRPLPEHMVLRAEKLHGNSSPDAKKSRHRRRSA
eukprot:440908-Amorphochlora_amoeboformis.AAC.2